MDVPFFGFLTIGGETIEVAAAVALACALVIEEGCAPVETDAAVAVCSFVTGVEGTGTMGVFETAEGSPNVTAGGGVADAPVDLRAPSAFDESLPEKPIPSPKKMPMATATRSRTRRFSTTGLFAG